MSIVHPSDSPFPENSVYAVHKGYRTGVFEYAAFRSAVNGYEPSKVRWAIFNDRKHAAEFVKKGVCPEGVQPIAKSDGDPERLGAAVARPTKVGSASTAGVATSQPSSTRPLPTPDASPEHESPPKPLPSSSTRRRIHDDSAVRLTVSQPPPAPKKPVAVAVSSDDEDDEGGDTEPEDEGETSRVARGLPGPSRTPAASSQPAALGKTPSLRERITQTLRQSASVGGLPATITDDDKENPPIPSTAPTSRPALSNTSTSRAGASSPTKAGPSSTAAAALPSTPSLSSTHTPAPKAAPALSRTTAMTSKAPTHRPLTPDPSRSSVVVVPQQAPVTPAPLTPAPSRTATTAPRTRLVLRTEPAAQTPELVTQPQPHGEYVRCHECTGTGWLLIPSTDNATTPAPSHPAGSIPTPTHTRTRTRTASKPRPKAVGGVTGSESEGFTREGSRLRIQSFGRSAAEGAGGVGPDRRRPSKRVVSDGVLERKKRDKGKGKAIDVDAMDVDAEFPVAGPSNLDYTYIIYALCFAVLLECEAMFRLFSCLYRYA